MELQGYPFGGTRSQKDSLMAYPNNEPLGANGDYIRNKRPLWSDMGPFKKEDTAPFVPYECPMGEKCGEPLEFCAGLRDTCPAGTVPYKDACLGADGRLQDPAR